MTRLEPGEILESRAEKMAAFQNEIESLQAKLKQAKEEIDEMKAKNRIRYTTNDVLRKALADDEYTFHEFTGRCSGGCPIMFKETTILDVILSVDDDDVVILRDCHILGRLHFEGRPGAIIAEDITFHDGARVTWSDGPLSEERFFCFDGDQKGLYDLFMNHQTDEEE